MTLKRVDSISIKKEEKCRGGADFKCAAAFVTFAMSMEGICQSHKKQREV